MLTTPPMRAFSRRSRSCAATCPVTLQAPPCPSAASSAARPAPAFAVTNTADYDMGDGFGTAVSGNQQGSAEAAIGADQANVLGPQQLVKLNPLTDLEEWLRTADNARAFISAWRYQASQL